MASGVKTHIVRIGNSQGVRIPKQLLEQSGINDEVELSLQEDQIVIRSAHRPRHDWRESFRTMNKNGDDALLCRKGLLAGRSDQPAGVGKDE